MVLLCSLLFASCSNRDARVNLRVAALSNSIGSLDVHVAKSLRLFEQEGLDVQLEEFSSNSKIMQALFGGSADVCASNYEQTLRAAAVGRNVKSFFLLFTLPNVVLAASPAKPAITKLEHLKSRTAGVTALGVNSYLGLILLRHGMKPSDVTPVAIGSGASAVAAVESGKVDAGLLTALSFEVLRARRPEVKVLVDLRTREGTAALFGTPQVPTVAMVASSRWLAGNPDTARRVTRALSRAGRWIQERSAVEVAAKLPSSLQTPGSEAALRSLEFAMAGFSRDGRMPPGGPEAIHEFLKLTVDPSLNSTCPRHIPTSTWRQRTNAQA